MVYYEHEGRGLAHKSTTNMVVKPGEKQMC